MSAVAQHGYLLIADISGYTSFVAGTELEHSHEILADLLGTICEKIESLLTLHKLEAKNTTTIKHDYSQRSSCSRGSIKGFGPINFLLQINL